MKRIVAYGAVLLILIGCDNNRQGDARTAKDSLMAIGDNGSMNSLKIDSSKISPWELWEKEDKMTSKKVYFAQTTSKESLNLDFPYEGTNMAYLSLRFKEGTNNVYFQVDKGQFLTSVSDPTIVKVRFDDHAPVTFNCSQSTTGEPTILFFNSPGRFIKMLKKSTRVIIQAEMYHEGNQLMEFSTKHLVWNH